MTRWRRSSPDRKARALLTSDSSRSSVEECDALIETLAEGAAEQMRRAQLANLGMIVGGVSIPVLLLLSTQYLSFVLGKVAPAVIAAFVTGAGLAIQLTRPHERWRLLRLHQGLLEAERFRYQHQLGDYAADDRDQRLLETVVATSVKVASEWFGLMPESDEAVKRLHTRP